MKRMKFVCVLLIAVLAGCEDKNTIEDIQSEFILAGVDSDQIVAQVFPTLLRIEFLNETTGNFPTTAYSGDLLLDLDSDNSNDIMFHAYYGYGCSAAGCFSPTEACEISVIDNKEIEIHASPLSKNDIIDNNLTWTLLGPNNGTLIFSSTLSSYTPEWGNSPEIANNDWIDDDHYLAIRVKHGEIYKFGWIKLFIDDYYNIGVNEVAIEE